jgi:hypothetical protein
MQQVEQKPDYFSIKEERFIAGVAAHGNKTRAAKDAGYVSKNYNDLGYKIALKPKVKAEISRLQAEKIRSSGITQEYVLYNLRDILESIKEEKTPAYLQVKLRTNELLGKYLGLWNKEDGSQQRRVGELTDKELVALGMELAKSRNAEPKQIDATITDTKVGNAVGKDKDA